MKMFGVIILTIMTGGIFAIVYSINKRRKAKAAKHFAEAVRDQALAYSEFEKSMSEDQKKIVTNMMNANAKYADAYSDLTE